MTTAHNDITRDSIKTKPNTELYATGWERIFGKNKVEIDHAKDDLNNILLASTLSNPLPRSCLQDNILKQIEIFMEQEEK